MRLTILPGEMDKAHQKSLRKKQREVRVKSISLKKFIRGQVLLADWLQSEYEASPLKLMTYNSPKKLYKQLQIIGYVWDSKSGFWRLRKGRTAPKYFYPTEE